MSQDAVSNNVFTYNKEKSSHRNLYANRNSISKLQPQEKQVKIPDIQNSKNSANNCPKKKLIIILSISFLTLIIIAGIIVIIGNYKFGWFKKKNNLVVEKTREINLVTRYLEKKNASNYFDIEGLKQTERVKNLSIITDFIVAINKKNKINKILDFSEPNYLYEAFLLIINLTERNETDSVYLGGFNIYDKSKSFQDLIKQNDQFFYEYSKNKQNLTLVNKTDFKDNIPFCKFYFYENGTIDGIYFSQDMNEFYKTEIVDLIQKVTPKLSKSLYKNETTNIRRLENEGEEDTILNYEQILKNGVLSKTILYEDKKENDISKNNGKFKFEDSQINSQIIRIFNSSGDMVLLEMKGEASFKSTPSEEKNILNNSKNKNHRLNEEIQRGTNNTYYNLGFNEFKMSVTSNMELIQNNLEPNILENLKELTKTIIFEEYKNPKSTFIETKGNEISLNNTNEIVESTQANKKRNLQYKGINFNNTYDDKLQIVKTNFLGLNIDLRQGLYINNKNGTRKGYINLYLGKEERTYSIQTVHSSKQAGSATKEIFKNIAELNLTFSVLGIGVEVKLGTICNAKLVVSYDVKNGEMIAKSSSSIEIGAYASLGVDILIVSLGVKLKGNIFKGDVYIQGNTLIKSGSKLALFNYYKKFNLCSVDLTFFITVYILFWKKTFDIVTIPLFDGFWSSIEKYSKSK